LLEDTQEARELSKLMKKIESKRKAEEVTWYKNLNLNLNLVTVWRWREMPGIRIEATKV